VKEERRRILEMVEQGRMTAQEANELLAALGESERERPRRTEQRRPRPDGGRNGCGPDPETVGNAVSTVVKALFRRRDWRSKRRAR
jgi:DUF4097 and DUF4098 domain-containing protein YvlB